MPRRQRGRQTHRNTEGRKLLRELLGRVTQAEVAQAIGAKQQYVSNWARGGARPEPQYREALQRVYGVPSNAWYSADELAIAKGARVATAAAE